MVIATQEAAVSPSSTWIIPPENRFTLDPAIREALRGLEPRWGYGAFSEFIFYRTYSRDGEDWADVITRVIEGVFSIRKHHYLTHDLPWDETAMQGRAREMALSAFAGEWGPPGRGYWAMGTDLVYQLGSMALNNCGFVDVTVLSRDAHWAMDALMLGVGVGFSAYRDVVSGLRLPRTASGGGRDLPIRIEVPEDDWIKGYPTLGYVQAKNAWNATQITYVVPDSREGWADSVRLLLESYETGGPTIRFDYGRLRPRGAKIKGFGGEASGYWPLKKLHLQVRAILNHAATHKEEWSPSRLITDVINLIGVCIVAGNVRRSATIALGHADDAEFAELKHYADYDAQGKVIPTRYWYRRRFGWMSNNSYVLSERAHFERLVPTIADGIKRNGEPGFLNLKAVRAFGRLGDRAGITLANGSVLRRDDATGINPCGEIPLESYELCCLAEWYPTRCLDAEGQIDFAKAIRAAEHAAFYTQSVQLLPTHRPETNAVIGRNRRTGVSLAGAAALRELTTMTEAIRLMEHGYDAIRTENKRLSLASGVPEAIRVTAEKPSGTTSLLMGVPAGAHWPTSGYTMRRVRVDSGRAKLREVLDAAGVPHEPDLYSANTEVYTFPIKTPGAERMRPSHEVSMWEQADFAAVLSQHFVDNATSVTVTFDPLTRQAKEQQSADLLHRYAELQGRLRLLDGPLAEASDAAALEAARADLTAQQQSILAEFAALQRRHPEGDDVERLVASYAGKLKSMSMLPRADHGYAQTPEEAIDADTYLHLASQIGPLIWSFFQDEGMDDLYCAVCEVM